MSLMGIRHVVLGERNLTAGPLRSRAAAKDAGLAVTDRTLPAWLEGKRQPSKVNLERIDAAYRTVCRRNVARHLLARLNREGRGTRDPGGVPSAEPVAGGDASATGGGVPDDERPRWERIVVAWASGDQQGLDDAWEDTIVDLGSLCGSTSASLTRVAS